MTSLVQKIPVDSNHQEYLWWQNAWKRYCWHCNIWQFDLICLLPTNCIIAYVTMAYRGLWETFYANSNIDQTSPIIWNFIVGKSSLREMANFSDYPRDTVQNLESPRLSGRVNSTVLGELEKEPIERGSYNGVNQSVVILCHWCYAKAKEIQVELTFVERKKPYLTLEKEILIKILEKKNCFYVPPRPRKKLLQLIFYFTQFLFFLCFIFISIR